MRGSFWLAAATSFLSTLILVVLIVAGLRHWAVPPSPQRFATSAFSFSLPAGWSCRREGTEYVCRNGAPPSDAIVILGMKMRGPQDTFAAYWSHLSSPLSLAGKGKEATQPGTARLISLRKRIIDGSPWVEAVLNSSEVFHYYTTYLAGNTAEIGILVTLSVHEQARDRRAGDLDLMMRSLIVNQRAAAESIEGK